MAYYTGNGGNSIKSNKIKSSNGTNGNSIVGSQRYITPNYTGTSAHGYVQRNSDQSSYDKNRGTVTYGGMGESGVVRPGGGDTSDKPSGGGSGGSGSSSGGTVEYTASSWNPNGLINAYMDDLNRRAEAAYNRSMSIINDYYNSAADNLRKNYDESVGTLDRNNDLNTRSINADAESAMRQAYINNMLSRKSLQQAMTAQGLNGGATETTRASLENNYGNARNNIDTTRNKNLADLMTQYQNNLASLRQQLNTGLSDLDSNKLSYSMQINNDLQDRLDSYNDSISDFINNWAEKYNNGETGGGTEALRAATIAKNYAKALDAYNNGELGANLNGVANPYMNNLQNLAMDSAYFGMNPAEAQNYYDPVSMQQAALSAGSTNYQKALAAQEALGATTPSARNTALSRYGNISSLQEILRQLGYGGY